MDIALRKLISMDIARRKLISMDIARRKLSSMEIALRKLSSMDIALRKLSSMDIALSVVFERYLSALVHDCREYVMVLVQDYRDELHFHNACVVVIACAAKNKIEENEGK